MRIKQEKTIFLNKTQKWLDMNRPNGKCLDIKYIGSNAKILFKCNKENCGHEWYGSLYDVKIRKSWCPKCIKRLKLTLNDISNWLLKYHPGSICLETEYKNNQALIKIQCICGNIFKTSWGRLNNQKSWCPICVKRAKPTMNIIYSFLNKKHPGGKCLSKIYKNNRSKMIWKCEKCGNEWAASWKSINICNSWCPNCNYRYGEKCCKKFFETIFGLPFPKIRPEFLQINPNDKRSKLELDGYCSELNLAWEYQGEQHNKMVKKFHDTPEKLKMRQNRDVLKKNKCAEINLPLIIIEQFHKTITPSELKSIIKPKLILYNIQLPSNFDEIEFSFSDI